MIPDIWHRWRLTRGIRKHLSMLSTYDAEQKASWAESYCRYIATVRTVQVNEDRDDYGQMLTASVKHFAQLRHMQEFVNANPPDDKVLPIAVIEQWLLLRIFAFQGRTEKRHYETAERQMLEFSAAQGKSLSDLPEGYDLRHGVSLVAVQRVED